MKYTLGIDIGIASVGWCLLDNEKLRIADLGVRTFVAAENPKNGAPLAEPRRIARSIRRRIRRRSHRISRLRSLLVREHVISTEEMEQLYQNHFSKDPYTLRVLGLDNQLNPKDWCRVLLHIAKRRGFKSNRKSDENEKESGQLLGGIEENQQIMAEYGYRTVGEMLLKHEKFAQNRRNKSGTYINTLSRKMLENEVHILFVAQRQHGNPYASEKLEAAFCQIHLSQRPFAAKDDILKLIGKCTFELDELRAPKHSFTAERFVLLQKINNLKLISLGGTTRLTHEQRSQLEFLAYSLKEVRFDQIRKELKLAPDWQFAGLSYYKKGGEVNPEKSIFISLTGFHKIKKAIMDKLGAEEWSTIRQNHNLLDNLSIALTFYKTDEDIVNFLTEKDVDEHYISAVMSISFDKVQHLSIKAMRKIIPFLEEGFTYGEACEQAGYCHWNPQQSDTKHKYLTAITSEQMKNPVVRRALVQARKVINAIIRKYNSPYHIHVEVARELSKPRSERDAIAKEQKNYQDTKEQLREQFAQHFNRFPSSQELLKYRFYREQDSRCAYTQEYFDPIRVIEPGYAEVDHILPHSRSFDDSMSNKVLVKTVENRNKGNRTPFEYMGNDPNRWHCFEEWVKITIKNKSKQNRLLRQSFNEKDETEMKSRNLNDTRYISSYLAQLLKQHLLFDNLEDKTPVLMVNGQMTAFLRAKWGLIKARENGDLHHALDAAVIAASSNTMVRRISIYSKSKELYYFLKNGKYINTETGEIKNGPYKDTIDIHHFPQPWLNFREELLSRLSDDPKTFLTGFHITSYTTEELNLLKPVFVSRAPTRKITGPAHQETIRSKKCLEHKIKIQKIPLARLSWDKAKNDFKEEIHGKQRDWRLYEALKKRVIQYNGDIKAAFSAPFYKPVISSEQSPPMVRGVKICVPGTSGIEINGGIADNGAMIKVLVYEKGGKYYLVPVYVPDMTKDTLPCKAVRVGKDESEWIVIDSTFKYIFSLYPNDLIHAKTKKQEILGYYKSFNRNNGQLCIESPDRRKIIEGKKDTSWLIAFGTILSFEKLTVDPLGNYYRTTKEGL